MRISLAMPSPEGMGSALELKERIRKISDLGYDAVEFLLNEPGKVSSDEIREILGLYDLKLSVLRTVLVCLKDKLSFSVSEKIVRKKAVEWIKTQIKFEDCCYS